MTNIETQSPRTPAPDRTGKKSVRRQPSVALLSVLAVLVLLAVLPLVSIEVPILLGAATDNPGALQVLSVAVLMAALAISYDIVFGYTGLLSFGHALFFALGLYGTNILMNEQGLGYVTASLCAVVLATTIAAVVGALALRATGIAFAMVTLAFSEAMYIFVLSDPLNITGGEEGLPVAFENVPSQLIGVFNIRNVYWLALAVLVIVALVAVVVTRSQAGHVWQAIRENEQRVRMLGLRPYRFKLLAFTVAGGLAGLVGCVYLLATNGATARSSAPDFTLTIVVMVVLGGAGRIWGAALGGFVYGMLTLRLPDLSTSGAFEGLPGWLADLMIDPGFWMGVVFVAVVLAAPGGIAGLLDRVRRPPQQSAPDPGQ